MEESLYNHLKIQNRIWTVVYSVFVRGVFLKKKNLLILTKTNVSVARAEVIIRVKFVNLKSTYNKYVKAVKEFN